MKGFKAIISADIDRVFANTEEFFEVMSVDGRDMRIMLDTDSLNETKLQATAKTRYDGLYEANIIAYIPAADYGPKPKIGKPMTIGRKQYIILDCFDEAGVYKFTLQRHRILLILYLTAKMFLRSVRHLRLSAPSHGRYWHARRMKPPRKRECFWATRRARRMRSRKAGLISQ